ncbi:MAG: thioredoxin domain-containing protein [Flavobacteriales bacterium]
MNHLSKETSPYLLQHKNNPVHWHAWNDEALQCAKRENKMMLVSIGYSACHWCHVMEHEVFEDEECAAYMNAHFVCIKVDREERPDVDNIYMDALQLMGRQGGWPLNVFTTPDALPIYGGTYFPKQTWMSTMENLVQLFKTEPKKVEDYALHLRQGLNQLNEIAAEDAAEIFDAPFLEAIVENWKRQWDNEEGGTRKAPKFPMPNNWEFLLHYGALRKDREAIAHVKLTLEKMAMGGIYDQLAGGFARYSVDGVWKVPHFEKMLYDNAQLIALYAQAYRMERSALLADVVHQTIAWLQHDMKSPQGLYYAALDADSEGVEGKFYTWTSDELKEILVDQYTHFAKYFCVDEDALWEDEQNILLRKKTNETMANEQNISLSQWQVVMAECKQRLLQHRNQRIRPGLDDKCITSWNAMLITAFCEAHKSFPQHDYLQLATTCAEALWQHLHKAAGLYHTITKGHAHVNAFLEDYAFTAESFIHLFELSGDERWLRKAAELTEYSISHFFDDHDGLFFFTTSDSVDLIARKKDVQDNVIPSANSVMCKVLFKLAACFADERYRNMSKRMLANALPLIDNASGYSNWLYAYQWMCHPFHEVVITGEHATELQREMNQFFLPGTIIVASTHERSLPLFQNKTGSKTAIYVCSHNHCLAPVYSVEEAITQIQKHT